MRTSDDNRAALIFLHLSSECLIYLRHSYVYSTIFLYSTEFLLVVYSLLEMSNCFYSKLTVTIKQNLELRLHHSLHLLVKKLKALYQVLRFACRLWCSQDIPDSLQWWTWCSLNWCLFRGIQDCWTISNSLFVNLKVELVAAFIKVMSFSKTKMRDIIYYAFNICIQTPIFISPNLKESIITDRLSQFFS